MDLRIHFSRSSQNAIVLTIVQNEIVIIIDLYHSHKHYTNYKTLKLYDIYSQKRNNNYHAEMANLFAINKLVVEEKEISLLRVAFGDLVQLSTVYHIISVLSSRMYGQSWGGRIGKGGRE